MYEHLYMSILVIPFTFCVETDDLKLHLLTLIIKHFTSSTQLILNSYKLIKIPRTIRPKIYS